MRVHIYDADERSLISENIDLRLAFPQPEGDIDYIVAMHDLIEEGRHFCGGGAAPAFLMVPAHAYEPVMTLPADDEVLR